MLIPDNGINLWFSHRSMLPQEMISCGLSLGTHGHGISSTGLRQRVEHSRSNPPTMLHFIFLMQPWGSILFLTRIRVCGTRFGPLILPRKFKTSFGMLALTSSLPESIFDGGKYRSTRNVAFVDNRMRQQATSFGSVCLLSALGLMSQAKFKSLTP